MDLTDNEIIKALNDTIGKEHVGIYCSDKNGNYTTTIRLLDIIDLINRQKAEIEELYKSLDNRILEIQSQKAEIERLQEKYKLLESNSLIFKGGIDYFKAEAIKEFAEDLTNRICDAIEESMNNPNGDNYFITDVYGTIKDLVKELTEDKE